MAHIRIRYRNLKKKSLFWRIPNSMEIESCARSTTRLQKAGQKTIFSYLYTHTHDYTKPERNKYSPCSDFFYMSFHFCLYLVFWNKHGARVKGKSKSGDGGCIGSNLLNILSAWSNLPFCRHSMYSGAGGGEGGEPELTTSQNHWRDLLR